MAKKKRVRKRSLSLIDRCGGDQEIAEVCEHYLTYQVRWRGPKAKELRDIDAALENYTVNELKLAIDGLHLTDWNQGKNPSGTLFLGLYYAFHEDKIDGRIETAQKHVKELEREQRVKERIDREHFERVKANEDRIKTGGNSTQLYRKAMREASGTMN